MSIKRECIITTLLEILTIPIQSISIDKIIRHTYLNTHIHAYIHTHIHAYEHIYALKHMHIYIYIVYTYSE